MADRVLTKGFIRLALGVLGGFLFWASTGMRSLVTTRHSHKKWQSLQ